LRGRRDHFCPYLKVMMKNTSFLRATILLFLFFSMPLLAQSNEQQIWEHWPTLESALVNGGSGELKAYSNPRNPANILVYPPCWSILRDTQEVVLPSCHFELKGDKLYCNTQLQDRRKNGAVGGISWDDPKTSTSLFSTIMRRPKFHKTSVKFWNGKEWIEVSNLRPI
jgi:hypothetical protein